MISGLKRLLLGVIPKGNGETDMGIKFISLIGLQSNNHNDLDQTKRRHLDRPRFHHRTKI